METVINPKCSKCRCYWKPDETDRKSSGLYFKTCQRCRGNNQRDKMKQYEHYNEKFVCECGGHYTRKHKAKHLDSKIHTEYIKLSIN